MRQVCLDQPLAVTLDRSRLRGQIVLGVVPRSPPKSGKYEEICRGRPCPWSAVPAEQLQSRRPQSTIKTNQNALGSGHGQFDSLRSFFIVALLRSFTCSFSLPFKLLCLISFVFLRLVFCLCWCPVMTPMASPMPGPGKHRITALRQLGTETS